MLALVLVLAQGPRFVELRTGMVISQSMLVATKVYRLSGPPIVIRGDNIIVDFRGATLEGTASDADPDQARDTAHIVDGGHDVRILNAHVSGYEIGIPALGTPGLE